MLLKMLAVAAVLVVAGWSGAAEARTAPRDAVSGMWRMIEAADGEMSSRELDRFCAIRNLDFDDQTLREGFLFILPYTSAHLSESEVFISENYHDIGVTGLVEVSEQRYNIFGVRKFVIRRTGIFLYLSSRTEFGRASATLRVVSNLDQEKHFVRCSS